MTCPRSPAGRWPAQEQGGTAHPCSPRQGCTALPPRIADGVPVFLGRENVISRFSPPVSNIKTIHVTSQTLASQHQKHCCSACRALKEGRRSKSSSRYPGEQWPRRTASSGCWSPSPAREQPRHRRASPPTGAWRADDKRWQP